MSDLRFIVLVVAITIVLVVLSILFFSPDGFLTYFVKSGYFTDLDRIEDRLINIETAVDSITAIRKDSPLTAGQP